MITSRRIFFAIFIGFVVPHQVVAIYRINVFRPYNINLRPARWPGEPFQLTAWSEFGTKTKGYNAEGKEVNPLQIFNRTVDTLAMLRGVAPVNEQQQMLIDKLENIPDVSNRGHVRFTGDLNVKAGFGLNARYHFPYNITLAVFLPFYSMSLKDVEYVDLTGDIDEDDMIVKQCLTSKLPEVVALFDPELSLDGWKRTGVGDVAAMIEWWRDFPQGKPILKNVAINARIGVSLPTGKKENIEKLLSVPFGCDGVTALIFGAGLDLNWFECLPWVNQIRGGFDVQFWQMFGNTRERRIKTEESQSDLLLLTKTHAYKDFGFTQRYNLYLEAYRFLRGLSLSATYQFFKQTDSTLALCTNQFSEGIANTAQSLEEWTYHQILFAATYDAECDVCPDSWFKPQIKVLYKLPFDGERSITIDSWTVVFSLNF